MNKLSTEKRAAVVRCLIEGCGVNSTVRMTGVSKPTILKLLRDLGEVCSAYHHECVRGLRPETVQADECWSFNYCKQKRVATAKAAPPDAGDTWLWTAITDQKLIASYRIGLRTQHDANEFMLDLAGRIVNRTQLSTDALSVYESAVINAFGFEIDYGQVRKVFGTDQTGCGAERKYSPGECCGAKKSAVLGMPDNAKIGTSFIERANLSFRMGLRRYTRLTPSHSKKLRNHCYAVAIFVMYYNYARPHQSLGGKSPAWSSGLSNHVWSLEELIGLLD